MFFYINNCKTVEHEVAPNSQGQLLIKHIITNYPQNPWYNVFLFAHPALMLVLMDGERECAADLGQEIGNFWGNIWKYHTKN